MSFWQGLYYTGRYNEPLARVITLGNVIMSLWRGLYYTGRYEPLVRVILHWEM